MKKNKNLFLNRSLSAEETKMLTGLQPTARKWMIYQFGQGKTFLDIPQDVIELSKLEQELRSEWKQNTLKEMRFYKFRNDPNLEAYVFCKEFANCAVHNEKLLSNAKYSYSKNKNKNVFRFLNLLKKYMVKIADFQRYAFEMFQEGKTVQQIREVAESKENEDEITAECRLFTKQAIKHVKFMQARKIPVPLSVLKISLDCRFSNDSKIMEDQTDIVRATYGAYEDSLEAARIMSYCFQFIAKAFYFAPCPSPKLIEYLLLEDRISDLTYEIWTEVFPSINRAGMNVLVYEAVKKLADKIDRSQKTLSNSDANIIAVMNLYDPERRSKKQALIKQKAPA